MQPQEYAVVSRDCRVVEIPQGTPALLPAGTHVRITQSLGGSYTVMTEYGQLLRIDDKSADAIGKGVPQAAASAGQAPAAGQETHGPAGSIEEKVWAALRTCYDPEIPVNVVDLGLVYSCEVSELPDGGSRVAIQMTLTAPGCGMGPVIADDVKRKVEEIAGVREVQVEVVFDPQWNQNMMTEAARLQLGLF
ncbi:MAG TPA: putative Fe-S cluster assembly protein SufT [Solirubrobacterales bacterium]|nr:putative Fe-S cluster assembly protein SufT [Solirubrobacterales bacterium]